MKEKKPKVSLKLVFYLILKKYKFIQNPIKAILLLFIISRSRVNRLKVKSDPDKIALQAILLLFFISRSRVNHLKVKSNPDKIALVQEQTRQRYDIVYSYISIFFTSVAPMQHQVQSLACHPCMMKVVKTLLE